MPFASVSAGASSVESTQCTQKSAVLPTYFKAYQTTKLGSNLVGVNLADKLAPTDADRRRYGLTGNNPAKFAEFRDRLIVAEGANHVAHDDSSDTSRPWRLDPIPVLIDARQWATLERSLLHRARLLEALLADVYGPQRLLHEGVVPPAVVLGHRGYQRACAGVTPVSGNRMTVYGADVVRDATGRFVAVITERRAAEQPLTVVLNWAAALDR